MTYISPALRRQVEQRANDRCEYCLLPADVTLDAAFERFAAAGMHLVQSTESILSWFKE